MKYLKKYVMAVACFLMFFLCVGFIQPVYAEEANEQIVKVAYFDMGDYYDETSEGNVKSYDTELLSKLENYSKLKFEYVNCGTWANALEMMNNHQVDLVGTVQWNEEREEEYEFCLESYGYTVGELAGLAEDNFIYEDYDTIGKSVIGCTENYVRREEMDSLFDKHGISPVIKTYAGQEELENALESNEIDLVAANSHTLKKGWDVVEKFSYAPFYFVSWKGNKALIDQIDGAMIALSLSEPGCKDELMKEYFPSIMGAPLTKEEMDLISENQTYDVYFDATTKPTSWYDSKTGEMNGALVDVCNQVSEATGLKFNLLPRYLGETQLDDTDTKTTTLFNGIIEDFSDNPGTTNALLDEEFNFFYRSDNKLDLSTDSYTVALVTNREQLQKYINEKYPNATIVEYDSPVQCMQAVSKGEADLTYLDCRIAENAILENGITGVREFPVEATKQGIALSFGGENKELLASIFNKGLVQVNQNEVSNKLVQYALETQEPVTWTTIIRDHPYWMVLIIVLIFIVAMFMAIMYTYARVMKKQKEKVEKADKDKMEFFARMSHDMRTPMNGILGMIRLSKESNDVSEMHGNLNKAESAGEYMLSLINDTLDLQRLESERLKLEKNIVNTNEYYDSIFNILKISAEQKNLQFVVRYDGIEMDNYVVIDQIRLKQILSNLISNAIKFTSTGGAVEVIVENKGQDDDVLHRKYQVIDTGVGMSEDFIKNRLFMPYSQENNELSSELTGSGLGMAITKNLVELMGGRLEVESALGEGTRYSVYLDIKQASKEEVDGYRKSKQNHAGEIEGKLSGKRLLLCEDHPLNAEIAMKLLDKTGCTVEWVQNGKLGLEKFGAEKENYFDLILMDIRMPVMDGLEATREIRKLEKSDAGTIPIIAMTANAYESDVNNCMMAGMNAHIAKPIEPGVLYQTIYKYTKKD